MEPSQAEEAQHTAPQFTYLNPNPNPNPNSYAAYYYAQQNSAHFNLGYYPYHPNPHLYAPELGTSVTVPVVAAEVNPIVPVVAAQVNPIYWENAAKSKILKKRKNPVQHFWCDVCKIECTSKDILESHKQGKKHKKNLEKPNATLAPDLFASVSLPDLNIPVIGPQENPNKRIAKEPEDLESKKKKIVAGGTAVDAVRTCEICNVVCNSEVVFRMHLAGQKHLNRSGARMIMGKI